MWVIIEVIKARIVFQLFYWLGVVVLGTIGYYWYEFLNYLKKHRTLEWLVILLGPFLYYLNKSTNIPSLNAFLVSAPISPLIAMIRVIKLIIKDLPPFLNHQ